MKASVLLSALFVAATLAIPSPPLTPEERFQRRRARRQAARALKTAPLETVQIEGIDTAEIADLKNVSHVEYSTNWAGAVLESPPSGTSYRTVAGHFTVPTVQKGSGSQSYWAASAWVGIDGDTYGNAILQTGVDFEITSSGARSYDAWYEWYPDYAYDFNLDVSAGDKILVQVHATTLTSGTAVVENLTTGKSVSKSLSSSSSLAGENAEWIVEDFNSGNSQVPFADFGTVHFTQAHALTQSGTNIGLGDATVLDIVSSNGNNVLTDVEILGAHSVEITYTG